MRRAFHPAALLVASVVAVLAEVMRVSFPLLYHFAGDIGFTTAAGIVPLLFATSLLAAPLAAVVGVRGLLIAGAGGLAVARVVLQFQHTPGLVVSLVGLLLGMAGLSAALRVSVVRAGQATSASALFLGLAVDTAIRVALTTWDAAWRSDPFSWTVGVALPVAMAVALVAVLFDRGPRSRLGADSWWFAVLPGAVLALQTLFLANPAFVASSGQTGLPLAGAVTLIGLGLAAAAPAAAGAGGWTARFGIVVVAAALTGPTGLVDWPVPLGVLVGQVAIGALVSAACVRVVREREGQAAWRTGLGAGLGALVLVGTLLPYQISYEIPLGVPQLAFPVLGSLVVVLLAGRVPRNKATDEPAVPALRWVAALGPVLLLAIPAWSALTWPSATPAAAPEIRVATYNIHSAVDWSGRLDPAAIADVLERQGTEVAMLQEVARGWPLAGGLDTASWLARRLGAEVAYGGAADHQFGNAVLSTRPMLERWSGAMPQGEGTMRRGYVGATLEHGESTVDVWSTHLQHQDHTTETRRAQARVVLGAWADGERTIIGGDFNSVPDSPDIEPWFEGTGLVAAQDAVASPAADTSPALRPERRIDWILGTPDLRFSEVNVVPTLASDHLPVFASVQIAG